MTALFQANAGRERLELAVRSRTEPDDLDDCDERNGALHVVPGSHRFGRLRATELLQLRDERGESLVRVRREGAMVMKPLLLHASSKATTHSVRRVLHFVFGPTRLPGNLAWPSLYP